MEKIKSLQMNDKFLMYVYEKVLLWIEKSLYICLRDIVAMHVEEGMIVLIVAIVSKLSGFMQSKFWSDCWQGRLCVCE